MITTYSYPGSSSFCYVWHGSDAASREAASAWWSAAHSRRGPCAPGGGHSVSDRRARAWRYRDRTRICNLDICRRIYAPGKEPALPPGWARSEGDGFVLFFPS